MLGGWHHCAALKHSLPAVQAFEMYAQQGRWEAAHKVAAGYLSEQEVSVSVPKAWGCFLSDPTQLRTFMAVSLLGSCPMVSLSRRQSSFLSKFRLGNCFNGTCSAHATT